MGIIFYAFFFRCYSVADMPWYQRKIASTIFGADIPSSTYEEALEYFRVAESMQPLFYRYCTYYLNVYLGVNLSEWSNVSVLHS